MVSCWRLRDLLAFSRWSQEAPQPTECGLAALGVLMICAAAVILALAPTTVFVFAAEVLHGLTAGIIAPSLSAFDAEGHLVGFYPASV